MKKSLSKIIAVLISLCVLATSFSAMAFDMSYGVDVSEWNGTVNYDKAKADGNEFVMIRLGYGTAHLDKHFWENVKAAYNAGLDYGIYFYSYAYNEYEAQQEADFVIQTLSQLGTYAKNFTLPLAYDLEDSKISDRCSKSQITKIMTTFLDTIKAADYVPMVYANQNWFLNYIDLNTVVSKKYKIWYAYWNGKPNSSTQIEVGKTGVKADMWQYYGTENSSPTVFDKNVIYYTGSLVKPLACNHNYSITSIEKATASKDGKIIRECKNCTNKVTSMVIPKASNIKLSQTNFAYSGKVQKPTVTITDYYGNALTSGKDFTVSYSNASSTKVGEYTLTVNLTGNNYTGKTMYKYYINETDRWIKSGNRWWYRHANGTYTRNNWEKISGKWYHFDSAGWMQTGWLKVSGKWYYLNSSGAMQTGWTKVSNKWYYMNGSGAMLTGWQKIGGAWYYFNNSGAMLTGTQKIGNKTYYFKSSGQWIK